MNTLYLLDSFALAFRMFYAFSRNPLVNSQGLDVSLVHGYMGNVFRILATQRPSHFAVIKDTGHKNFRHELYPDYKANRGEMPEEMQVQLPMLEEILSLSGLPVIGREGYEADDVMASLAKKAEQEGFDVFLVTKDKDMAQILSDHVRMFQLEKGTLASVMGPEEAEAKYGVPPRQMRDYLALVGDSSDNVPGVPKVGPKTAVELLRTHDNLDQIYKHLGQIRRKSLFTNLSENRDKAFLSRELVTLQSSCDFGVELDSLRFQGVNQEALKQQLVEWDLRSLVRLMQDVPDRQGGAVPVDCEASSVNEDPGFQSECIQNEEALNQLALECQKADCIALDTETDHLIGWKANLVGVCLSLQDGLGYYIPVRHEQGENLPVETVRRFLTELCSRSELELVFHHAKYDLQVLAREGIEVKAKVRDTMLASWLLDPGQPSFGLDAQVHQRLHHEMIPIQSLIGRGKNQISFAQVSVEQAFAYGAEDAVYTRRLWKLMQPELEQKQMAQVLEQQEIPLMHCLRVMEEQGICLNTQELGDIRHDLSRRIHQLEKEVLERAGKPFNLNSPKQLGTILFEDLKLPVVKKTSTGYSTDASVLHELRSIHPIVSCLIEYREINKLLNTYVEVLPQLVEPSTGRIHTSFMQTGTATGRLSSRDPNLQNIPVRTAEGKRVRAAFRSRQSDWVLLSADYSQIELRILAHLSEDAQLIETYRQGLDIHARTAAALISHGEEMTADMRRQAKAVNFGVLYGMTAFRLARDLEIPRSTAKEFIDGYFGLYSRVKEWIDETVRETRERGYALTITGRRRYLPQMSSSDRTERMMAERMAINSPVQGSAADLIKQAMIQIHQGIQKQKLPLSMLLQVHDELVLECPRSEADALAAWVQEQMEQVMELRVPLVAEVGLGETWLQAH